MKKQWSEELQKRTENVLDKIEIASFMHNDRAHMKHITREGMAGFGFLTLENALKQNWVIEDREGRFHKYNSIDNLIADGWAID